MYSVWDVLDKHLLVGSVINCRDMEALGTILVFKGIEGYEWCVEARRAK